MIVINKMFKYYLTNKTDWQLDWDENNLNAFKSFLDVGCVSTIEVILSTGARDVGSALSSSVSWKMYQSK